MPKLEYGEKVDLDEKDKKILKELQKDARQNIVDIEKKTGLGRDVIAYRIKKMEERDVIRQHHTVINPQKIGYPLYSYVMFVCYNFSPEEEKRFVNYLKRQKNIVYVAKNSGKFDFTIGVCAKNYKEFDEIIREIRQEFPEMIKDFETLPTVQEYKFDRMAELVEGK